jgi:hypothetical protein
MFSAGVIIGSKDAEQTSRRPNESAQRRVALWRAAPVGQRAMGLPRSSGADAVQRGTQPPND